MLKKKGFFKNWLAVALFAGAVILAGISFFGRSRGDDGTAIAKRLSRTVTARLKILESYSLRSVPEDLPEDMVIYRYENDSLVAWFNQFPLFNDDIASRVEVQRLTSSRGRIVSPLADLTEDYSFVNYGPKWFVARCQEIGSLKIISGLEVANDLIEKEYAVKPLSGSVGAPVVVDGSPLFNVIPQRSTDTALGRFSLIWAAALLLVLSGIVFLAGHRQWKWFFPVAVVFTLLILGLYLYGRTLSGYTELFSPLIFADGALLYSLGALLLINLWITLLCLCLSMVEGRRNTWSIGLTAVTILLICIHTHLAFRSLVMNSVISTEFYKIATVSRFTPLVYGSFFLLVLSIPLLLKRLWPKVVSTWWRTVFAGVAALYFVVASAILGLEKERNRIEVWSNRLAMDRDITLELQLRSIDPYIQADARLALMSAQRGSNVKIVDNLKETYMGRIAQGNDISIYLLGDENTRGVEAIFNRRVRQGTALADDSHFFYSRDNNGRARYTGFFTYYVEGFGSSGLMICVESKANREDRGYLSLLGIADPGRVNLPHVYSYAKYVSGKLVTFNGNFAYPTLVSETEPEIPDDGYIHFIRQIGGDELIVMSRPRIEALNFFVEWFLFAVILFLLLSLAVLKPRTEERREKSYFRRRIQAVLFVSLLVTLVAMAAFSVYFVYHRNEANLQDIMTAKINSIQSVVNSRCRTAVDFTDLRTQEMRSTLENVGNSLKSDMTLYSPDGKAFMTTTPEIFDRMIIGPRLKMDVLDDIISAHKRFVISQESLNAHRYYSLYAPLFNADGEMVAIIGSPYTDEDYELENEALSHIATIIVVFLILLLLARFTTAGVIDRLFRPLSEMGAKMEAADLEHLELIEYDRDDEISSLVKAYNMMVQDLSESTQKLAQAERDQAWTSMARQVAHEIKNPLTPIKLQLQMLMLRKQNGDPTWVDRFDEASKIMLEHIDILVNSSNEFSTYAKLGMEETVDFDLDTLLKEEVSMFSSREDIEFTYIGLSGATVNGPKPQLTRCIVNLLGNAVEALDQYRESGNTTPGKIMVSLRNSIKDGYYDIVIEDNGPGVKEENQAKLFTPNFTTKSKGTGLGLAISRSIIEYCKGDIKYSRSFTLGGACFTIRYPK